MNKTIVEAMVNPSLDPVYKKMEMYLICAKFDPSLLTNGLAVKNLLLSDKTVLKNLLLSNATATK